MSFDEHFDVLPKNEPILYIWRIEKFELNEWKDTGAFHTGDAYLVYHAHRPNNRALIRDIYFWLGSECTQDESGTAALKAVNLDDYFGGAPIQHREVQYHESEAFNKLFEEIVIFAALALLYFFQIQHILFNQTINRFFFLYKIRE